LDSRIDNELTELKRSQAAELAKYNAELREVLRDHACMAGLQIDTTKAGIEELRSKIKEIVDYEKLSLQWLIKSIRSMQIRYQGSGHHYFSAKVDDFFDKDTPQPPLHLKSDQAPISRKSGSALKQEMQEAAAFSAGLAVSKSATTNLLVTYPSLQKMGHPAFFNSPAPKI
jgi:hypothetical protein